MDGWKMSFLLGFPIFRGYVKLRGGTSKKTLRGNNKNSARQSQSHCFAGGGGGGGNRPQASGVPPRQKPLFKPGRSHPNIHGPTKGNIRTNQVFGTIGWALSDLHTAKFFPRIAVVRENATVASGIYAWRLILVALIESNFGLQL